MFRLIIETSNERSLLVLAENSTVITFRHLNGSQLSSCLLLEVKNLLNSAELSLNQLDEVMASNGPGSFTGLRVGATIAKSLAYALKIKLLGFAFAAAYKGAGAAFAVLLDARGAGVYWQECQKGLYLPAKVVSLEELKNSQGLDLLSPQALKIQNRLPLALPALKEALPDPWQLAAYCQRQQEKFQLIYLH